MPGLDSRRQKVTERNQRLGTLQAGLVGFLEQKTDPKYPGYRKWVGASFAKGSLSRCFPNTDCMLTSSQICEQPCNYAVAMTVPSAAAPLDSRASL